MNDQITALLSQALASALKDALVPIVREAVTEALASLPQAEDKPVLIPDDIVARFATVEERLDSIESDLSDKVDSGDIDDKVSEAVSDCLDNGSWDISFRG
jgi:hypothetical protein